ncbi:transglutaminase-like domain-containing protein [Phreatobacter stygius]|uniref:Transglutaminase family protein n=1 Tax=Phreatobacter stygius TaxID=1940610 RepID=A0A4D7BAR4_9HYPH|nr:transglutaminase family protein [Phreatobacter stygius]QCI67773.1 transglutaminase family protein [Phreatobacter stygius]
MHIRYGFHIDILCEAATPLIALLDIHPSRRQDLTQADELIASALADPALPIEQTIHEDQFGNLCRRMTAPAGGLSLKAGGVIFDPGFSDTVQPLAGEVPPEQLPEDTLIYLRGSRYCETDQLSQEAWHRFGHVAPGWSRVQAITDFVHDRLGFGYHFARDTRTATQAFEERVGVCRDFAHLAITLCRCMNIPARYATGYLPDIGVPQDPAPMDFCAWFEAFLDGQWYTFDARHNMPRIGRIVMAYGQDAADVPLVNSFGAHVLDRFEVTAEEVLGQRFPVSAEDRRAHAAAQTAWRRNRSEGLP